MGVLEQLSYLPLITKCFDLIDRNILFYKMTECGIDGKMYLTLKKMYSNTMSCVNVNDYLSGLVCQHHDVSWHVTECHHVFWKIFGDFWWSNFVTFDDMSLIPLSMKMVVSWVEKSPGAFYWRYTWGCINSCVSNNLMLGVKIIICNLVPNSWRVYKVA